MRMTAQRRAHLEAAQRGVVALRDAWRDAMEHHKVRVEAQFRELATRLKVPAKGGGKGLPSAQQAKDLHDQLAKAHLKPLKGRAKDLRRAERLVQDALATLPEDE
jgi:hypothetical protein